MPVFDIDLASTFPKRSVQESSPFGGVLADAIAKRLAHAQTEKAETEAKYSERKTLSDILGKELENKWYGPKAQSEIGYQGAETRKINSMLPYEIQKAQEAVNESKRSNLLKQQIQNIISGGNVNPRPGLPYPQQNGSIISSTPLAQQNVPPMSNVSLNQQNISENGQEKIIDHGSAKLSGIDDLYDNNPLARSELEKMGLKKTQQIKIDKSGNPTIVTRYPSGKITVQSQNNISDEGIPLTNTSKTQHQKVVSSVDVAIPVLDKIINLNDSEYSRAGGWTNKGAKYGGIINQGLDSLLGAFGLPQTNEGIHSMLSQLEIGHGESPRAYRDRIRELKKDILKRKNYSSALLNKRVKNQESTGDNDPYDLDKYDSGES